MFLYGFGKSNAKKKGRSARHRAKLKAKNRRRVNRMARTPAGQRSTRRGKR